MKAEDKVGLCLVGEGELSFSLWTRYVLLPDVMLSCDSLLEAVLISCSSSADESMKETFCGAISSSSGAGTLVCGLRGARLGEELPATESLEACLEYDGLGIELELTGLMGVGSFCDSDNRRGSVEEEDEALGVVVDGAE